MYSRGQLGARRSALCLAPQSPLGLSLLYISRNTHPGPPATQVVGPKVIDRSAAIEAERVRAAEAERVRVAVEAERLRLAARKAWLMQKRSEQLAAKKQRLRAAAEAAAASDAPP